MSRHLLIEVSNSSASTCSTARTARHAVFRRRWFPAVFRMKIANSILHLSVIKHMKHVNLRDIIYILFLRGWTGAGNNIISSCTHLVPKAEWINCMAIFTKIPEALAIHNTARMRLHSNAVDHGLLLLDVLNVCIYHKSLIQVILLSNINLCRELWMQHQCCTHTVLVYNNVYCIELQWHVYFATCTWQRTANYKNICKYLTVLHSPLARLCVFYSRSNINSSPSKVALKPGSTTWRANDINVLRYTWRTTSKSYHKIKMPLVLRFVWICMNSWDHSTSWAQKPPYNRYTVMM